MLWVTFYFVFCFLSPLLANQHHPRQLFTVSESASRCPPVAPTLDPFPIMVTILEKSLFWFERHGWVLISCMHVNHVGKVAEPQSWNHSFTSCPIFTMRWKQEESKDLASTCVFVAMRLDLESSHRYLAVSPSVLVVRVRQCLPWSEA